MDMPIIIDKSSIRYEYRYKVPFIDLHLFQTKLYLIDNMVVSEATYNFYRKLVIRSIRRSLADTINHIVPVNMSQEIAFNLFITHNNVGSRHEK